MGFLSLIPTIAGAASSLFGKKTTGGTTMPAQTLLPDNQQKVGNQLYDYITKYLSQYQPGKDSGLDFGLLGQQTPFESTGLTRLEQFLAAPELGSLFDTSKNALLDTISGKNSNPLESPFIQAMQNLSKINLQDNIDASRRSAGSRGSYFTRSAMEGENRLMERSGANMDAIVGDFINQERGRQLSAIPQAMALEKYGNMDVPLAKIGASQQYGALPRILDTAELEASYQDFQRKQKELGGVVGDAQSFFGNNTPYAPSYTTPNVQQNSTLGNILGVISKLNLGALSGSGSIWDKLGGVLKG